MVSIPMTFSSANSTEYLVSTVGGTVSLKGLILAEGVDSVSRLKEWCFYMLKLKKNYLVMTLINADARD
uniref:Uncharacterized protein n=1 Tax=Tanacetum cinerariifolium TaxID=118510 RepID=A0A6L2M9L5_TANCI|nr:hypothetical protein [Tanacetum cinerariifolium]